MQTLWFCKRDHILYNYRAHENMTTWMCLKSFFYLHNETMSILSHFLPGIYFSVQLYWIVTD